MAELYNKRNKRWPEDAVYVGRPTIWGNPFLEGLDGTREEVCVKYEEYINRSPYLTKIIKERLKGKNLVCWCVPLRCHGETLLKIANG